MQKQEEKEGSVSFVEKSSVAFVEKSSVSFVEKSCVEFVEELASNAPVPGGGGASALVGAIGIALGNMVGSLTLGKPRYADVEADVLELKRQADTLQTHLLELVERDAQVFEPLSRAYKMPNTTPQEQAEKTHIMQTCLRECCAVPLEIMQCCADAIDLHGQFAQKGSAFAISDIGCGVICCKAALQAASLNVFVNTKLMTDRSYAEATNKRAQELLDSCINKADVIFDDVRSFCLFDSAVS